MYCHIGLTFRVFLGEPVCGPEARDRYRCEQLAQREQHQRVHYFACRRLALVLGPGQSSQRHA